VAEFEVAEGDAEEFAGSGQHHDEVAVVQGDGEVNENLAQTGTEGDVNTLIKNSGVFSEEGQ